MNRQRGRHHPVRVALTGLLVVTLAAAAAGCEVSRTGPSTQNPGGHDGGSVGAEPNDELVAALTTARMATVRYATDLLAATADGYQVITPVMPDMGVHYRNPTIQGFDLTRPPILVYVNWAGVVQLGALEWVFTEKPATPPLPGATYGSFDAACHYVDGEFVPSAREGICAKSHPATGAAFSFWHPNLVTLHVWLWYPNPAGLYHPTNPLVRPYNAISW